jgi:hypothetical protein
MFGSLLILYGVGFLVLSPILKTLTHNISDDTIASMSIGLLLIHVYFQDYAFLSAITSKFVPYSEGFPSATVDFF